jgi:tetratricopeptide (TPR) repeat protein
LYDKVLDVEGSNKDVMDNKGVALNKLGKYQEAIEWFDKALQIDSNYTYTMNNKGVALANLGKYNDAIQWFDRALSAAPAENIVTLDIISNKAFLLGLQLKEYDEALALTEEHLQRNPNHKGLLCTTLEIYKETGYEDLALEYEQTLVKLDPNYQCGLIETISGIETESFA